MRERSRHVEIPPGGLRIHYSTAGVEESDRLPVVLVHGIGVSGRYLLPTARALAPYFIVHVPDLPGFGRSEKPRRGLGVPELADSLLAFLDALGIGRACLLGNSMGCQVLVEVALREPARVSRLVLTGPTVDPSARSVLRHIPRFLRDGLREPPGMLAILAYDYAVFGPRRFMAAARSALADPIEDKLPRVEAPTLVVRGSRDGIVSQRWAETAAQLLPRGELVVLEGAPHAVTYAAPEALARVVVPFFAEAT